MLSWMTAGMTQLLSGEYCCNSMEFTSSAMQPYQLAGWQRQVGQQMLLGVQSYHNAFLWHAGQS